VVSLDAFALVYFMNRLFILLRQDHNVFHFFFNFRIIFVVNNQGLHAINLGDSGFIVVRDGCTVFRSPVQQHGFNFTYQLENGNNGDLPSSGQVSFCMFCSHYCLVLFTNMGADWLSSFQSCKMAYHSYGI
jgi:hypothetical protein